MPSRRPSVLAHENFVKHREAIARLPLAERFAYIADNNVWGSPESRSGTGSALEQTQTLIEAIPAVLRRVGADSLLDIPCGDFHWLSMADLGVDYTGADIVQDLVDSNSRQYGAPGRRFLRLDLTADRLPRASVVLCRDCLVHLSFANIARALANVRASGAGYLLMTHFPLTEENADVEDGDWRSLNFTMPPFNLPAPLESLVENCGEDGGAYGDKSLSLWRAADLG
jgi:hypothetical protein